MVTTLNKSNKKDAYRMFAMFVFNVKPLSAGFIRVSNINICLKCPNSTRTKTSRLFSLSMSIIFSINQFVFLSIKCQKMQVRAFPKP